MLEEGERRQRVFHAPSNLCFELRRCSAGFADRDVDGRKVQLGQLLHRKCAEAPDAGQREQHKQ